MNKQYFLHLSKSDIDYIKHAVTFCPFPTVYDVHLDAEALYRRRVDILDKLHMQTEAQDKEK